MVRCFFIDNFTCVTTQILGFISLCGEMSCIKNKHLKSTFKPAQLKTVTCKACKEQFWRSSDSHGLLIPDFQLICTNIVQLLFFFLLCMTLHWLCQSSKKQWRKSSDGGFGEHGCGLPLCVLNFLFAVIAMEITQLLFPVMVRARSGRSAVVFSQKCLLEKSSSWGNEKCPEMLEWPLRSTQTHNLLRTYLGLHYFYKLRGLKTFLSSTEVFYHAVLYCWYCVRYTERKVKDLWVESWRKGLTELFKRRQ